jgi:hypothetical protein
MPRTATATLNYQLTRFAQGHSQDLKSALAEFLCPTVPVPGSAGQYKQFNDLNSFQIYSTARAIGGGATRISFDATDKFYNCQPQALEVTVDMKERDDAGVDNPMAQQLLDEGKVKALLNSTILSRDKKVIDAVIAALAAVAGRGQWSDPDIDPIDQLDEQLEALVTATGSSENIRMALGIGPWRKLRNHPKVKARCTGVQVGGISIEQLSAILMFPVQIRVGTLSYNENKEGKAASKKNMMSDNAIIVYGVPNPTAYDPSAFKLFTTGTGRVDSVRTWRDPSDRFDVHAVDWSEDVKQTSTAAAVRLAIT